MLRKLLVFLLDMVWPGRAGGGAGARGRSRSTTKHRRDAGSDGLACELGADEVHVTVEGARRQNETFTGDRLRADAHH